MILLPHANPQSTGSVLPGIGLENDFLDCSVLRYLNPEIREILMDLEWHCDISSTSMVALRSTSLGARPVICCSRRCATILSFVAVPLKGSRMVAGFLLVELGLWLSGRLMRSHMEAAGAREEL